MAEIITLYDLFQDKRISEKDALEVAKTKRLEKIVRLEDREVVQIYYGEKGWLTREYKFRHGATI